MRALMSLLLCIFAFACSSSSRETLNVYTWVGIIKPELITRFEKEFNCRVVVDTYDSNEALYAKLKLGATGYDLIFPSNYYLEILQKQGLIQALNHTLIPNLKHLDPKYCCPPEPLSGVPFTLSFSGLAYRSDRISPFEPTYGVFARTDIRGRMTMLNDSREVLGAALKFLGYSINTRDPLEVAKAGDQAIAWRRNLAKFESEQYKTGLASGEFLLVQGYSIDIMQVRAEHQNIAFAFPKEGAIMHLDHIAIPSGARNVPLAHKFVNFLLEADVAAENMSYTFALIPVMPAYDLIDPTLRSSPILFPSPEHMQKMELIKDVQEDIRLYNKAWDNVKAG